MPTQAMKEADKDYAVSFACPTDAEGMYMIYGKTVMRHQKTGRGS